MSQADLRSRQELLELTARLKASYLKRENGLIESRAARRDSACTADVIVQMDQNDTSRAVSQAAMTPVGVSTPPPHRRASYGTLPIQRRGSPDSQAVSSATGTSGNGHHIRLKSALKPLCTSINICGLNWKSDESSGFDCHSVLSVIVAGVATIAFIMFFTQYSRDEHLGPVLAKKLATHVWQLQAVLVIPCFQYTYYAYFARLVRRWEAYKRKYTGCPLHIMTSFTYRATAIVDAVFAVVIFIIIIAFSISGVSLVTYQISPFYRGTQTIPPYISFAFFIFNGILLFIWLQPLLFLFIVAVLVRKEFMELNKNFKTSLALGMESRSRRLDVEGYRLRHIQLCKLTYRLDDMMAGFICITYVLDIPLLCGMIYVLLCKESQDPDLFDSVGAGALTSLVPIIHLIAVTLIGATLTHGARSPQTIVLDCDLRACTVQEAVSLQVFLSKIGIEHIGLTIWKIINVDKPVLIVVLFTVGTYICLLLKIGIGLWVAQLLSDAASPNTPPPERLPEIYNASTTAGIYLDAL